MKRTDLKFIFAWVSAMLVLLPACADLDSDWDESGKSNEAITNTRADRIEYTIQVKTRGALQSIVEAGNYTGVRKLTLTGYISQEDVNYAINQMATVEELDLSGAEFESESVGIGFLPSNYHIKVLSIPNNINTIEDGYYTNEENTGVFTWCHYLKEVTLPEGLTYLGRFAFISCKKLTSVNIPEGVKIIKYGLFAACDSLKEITIPEGVTTIEDNAFERCPISSITIPESVTSIGNYLFVACPSFSLKSIYWRCSLPLDSNIFYNSSILESTLLYIYTKDDTLPDGYEIFSHVVIDGEIDTLDITNTDRSCSPGLTKVKKISYTKYFYPTNSYVAGGRWYTISLPFTPTEITSDEKGTLAPFDSDIPNAKNFWLKELTPEGYKDVTTMEAFHSYIIAMPSSTMYTDEFNISGDVTFTAENVEFDGEGWQPVVSKGATYSMYPTFESAEPANDIYTLNTTYWVSGYDYGTVFVHGAESAEPYQAYVKANDATATLRSVIPISSNKRTAVRAASSLSDKTDSRGVEGKRKPRKEDM